MTSPPEKQHLMTHRCLCPIVLSVAVFVARMAGAQNAPLDETNSLPTTMLDASPAEKLNRIGVSYRMGLNITVDFKKLGGLAPLADPGPDTGSTYNRNYDNGSYNRVDSSGNAGGMTWYWGYENPNQLQGNAIVMESSSSPNNGVSKNRQDDPQHGFEITYDRQLYRYESLRFGAEAGLGYTTISVGDSRTVTTTVNRITDTFSIPEGVIVPVAPYHGTYEGPGALLSSSLDPGDRTRTILSHDAIITGRRDLDADVFTLRIGPYLEFPIWKRLSFGLSGGLTLAVGDTHFSYRETVTIADTGRVGPARSSSGSQTDFLVGGYVGGNLSYALTSELSIFAGAQYQAAGRSINDTRLRNGDPFTKKQSILDLGESLIVSVGASYSF